MNRTTIKIGNKIYKVLVAESESEKEEGLSTTKELPEDCGMLFVYDSPQDVLYYTMKDTSIDLDIIFIDDEDSVISVNSVKAFDTEPVEENNAKYVLEVNINSGIKEGDELDEVDDDDDEDFTDDERKEISNSKMLMLDSDGNVQMKLHGGERIISMIETRKLIKASLRAFHSDEDSDYKKVGRLIFKILDGQDSRDPEFTSVEG